MTAPVELPVQKAPGVARTLPRGPGGSTAALLALPFAILGAGLAAGVVGQGWYTWLVREDGVAENLQVLALAGAAAGSAVLAWRWRRRQNPVRAAVWAGLAVVLLFVTGEELSWGQRIGGWETPPALAELNRQAESNIHNVFGVESLFRVGQVTMLAVCGFVPLLLRARGRRPPAWLGLPPPVLTPYFLLPFGGFLVGLTFEPPPRYLVAWRESAELMELIVYLGIALTVASHRRDARP